MLKTDNEMKSLAILKRKEKRGKVLPKYTFEHKYSYTYEALTVSSKNKWIK